MIAIIDYNSGNVRSVQNALARLKVDSVITNDAKVIQQADRVIFPGQGRAGQAMAELQRRGLAEVIQQLTQPFLGICLGMQLLVEFSEEDDATGLGVLPGTCRRFQDNLPVPQIGWNRIVAQAPVKLLENIPNNAYMYFVHSYYLQTPAEYVVATSRYGIAYPSIVQGITEKNNYYGVQFHPEKSGAAGLQLLKNFTQLM